MPYLVSYSQLFTNILSIAEVAREMLFAFGVVLLGEMSKVLDGGVAAGSRLGVKAPGFRPCFREEFGV